MFIGKNHIVVGLAPDADRFAGTVSTDVINMEKYGHACFLIEEGAGGTGTYTLTVEECTSAAAAGATAIPFRYRVRSGETWGALVSVAATGYLTIAGADKAIAIEIDAEELSQGSNFVRVTSVESVDSPVDAAVIVILSDPRYPQDVPAVALA